MESICPICLNPLETGKISTLSCGHNICSDCIEQFIEFNNKCPVCNKTFMNYISEKDNKEHQLTLIKKKKEFELNEILNV